MNIGLSINKSYSKEDIENAFDTNFGARIKGITLRRNKNDEPYIILFSRTEGPYGDNIDGEYFYYDGEGLIGDQKLTAANKALVNANINKRTIFGFHQDANNNGWKYLGLLDVLNYEYILKGERKVYEFKLKINTLESPEKLDEAQEQLDEAAQVKEPILIEEYPNRITTLTRKYREASFRIQIKNIYNYSCSVCGKSRFTKSQYPEVESAHIYPIEKNGANDLRNGIALCKLHHWAFDGGLFTIADNYEIIVNKELFNDSNYEEIYIYHGKKITLPTKQQYFPHALYLKQHRIQHGFENEND